MTVTPFKGALLLRSKVCTIKPASFKVVVSSHSMGPETLPKRFSRAGRRVSAEVLEPTSQPSLLATTSYSLPCSRGNTNLLFSVLVCSATTSPVSLSTIFTVAPTTSSPVLSSVTLTTRLTSQRSGIKIEKISSVDVWLCTAPLLPSRLEIR